MLWKKGRFQNVNDGWPTHVYMDQLIHHAPKVKEWCDAIMKARHLLARVGTFLTNSTIDNI